MAGEAGCSESDKKWSGSHSVEADSLQSDGLQFMEFSTSTNTGAGSLSLLQGIFPNPGIEPRLPALQANSLPAEPPGKPRILEWVAYPFSRGSS